MLAYSSNSKEYFCNVQYLSNVYIYIYLYIKGLSKVLANVSAPPHPPSEPSPPARRHTGRRSCPLSRTVRRIRPCCLGLATRNNQGHGNVFKLKTETLFSSIFPSRQRWPQISRQFFCCEVLLPGKASWLSSDWLFLDSHHAPRSYRWKQLKAVFPELGL